MSFSINSNNQVIRGEDGVVIPRDITSKAYQDFLYWQSHGTIPGAAQVVAEPVVEAVPVLPTQPEEVIAAEEV